VYLHHSIKPYLNSSLPEFQQFMALQGECFRLQKGRMTKRIYLGGQHYFIKQHTGVGWKEIIKNIFQWRMPVLSAQNEWLAIKKLQALGIAVPQILAYGKQGFNPAKLQSFILMQELCPTISLETLCQSWQEHPPTFKFKHQLLIKVAEIAKRLHEHGMNHRDFYLCHFLLDTHVANKDLMADEIKLSLIDLHRAQIRRLTPRRWIIKDLSGLYFSSKDIALTRRDLFRFMKYYSGKSLRDIVKLDQPFWQKVRTRGEQLYRNHTQGQ